MAELKPVPGQILLSDEEFSTLITTAAHGLRGMGGDTDALRAAGERMVRSVMQTLNEWRFGQPAGELRRSPAGSLAVRAQSKNGALSWDVVHLDPADESTRGITDTEILRWNVIHHESWNGRLTDADYTETPTEVEVD